MIMYPITGLLADYSLAVAFLFLGITTLIFLSLAKVEVKTQLFQIIQAAINNI